MDDTITGTVILGKKSRHSIKLAKRLLTLEKLQISGISHVLPGLYASGS